MSYQNRSLGNTNTWWSAFNRDPYQTNAVPYDYKNDIGKGCFNLADPKTASEIEKLPIDWENPLTEFNKRFNKEIKFYPTLDKSTGVWGHPYYAVAMQPTHPVFCRYYPEKAHDFKSKRPEADCPCNCKEVVTKKTMYINKVKSNENDKPLLIDNEKIVCDSKDSKKSYSIPCDSNTDINQALNQLNGLMDCPCDCRKVITKETFYLSDVKLANSIAVPLNETKTVCETNSTNNRKLPCDVLNQAVNLNDEVGSDLSTFIKKNEEVITYSIAGIVALVLLKGVLS